MGYYKLDIKTPGLYDITCSISDLRKSNIDAYLQVGDKTLKRAILYAESQVRFENVHLPKGQLILKGWTQEAQVKSGYRFMTLTR